MIGQLILEKSLSSKEISEVISLVRKGSSRRHSSLREVVVSDFKDLEDQVNLFKGIDAAYFCIGVYTGQVPDKKFKEITIDYALSFAKALNAASPNARLCMLSGAGADRTETSNASFAKYKGIAENRISELGLPFHAFRPGYIYPVTPRKEPNIMYKILRLMYPLIKSFNPDSSIKSTELANAMFQVGLHGESMEILENQDILNYIKAKI